MDNSCDLGQQLIPLHTAVSAKYRGAFCEAEVKQIELHFDCKIQLADGRTVSSDEKLVRFLSDNEKRVGSQVEVTLPSSTTPAMGRIVDLKDKCLYHVEFDDGDTRTLRRSKLVIKGARHFKREESLDQLPLYNPEHFKNPVRKLNESGEFSDRRRNNNNKTLTEDSDTSSTLTRSSAIRRTKPSERSPSSPCKISPSKRGRKPQHQNPTNSDQQPPNTSTTTTITTGSTSNQITTPQKRILFPRSENEVAESLLGKVVKLNLANDSTSDSQAALYTNFGLIVVPSAELSMPVDWPQQVLVKSFKDARFHVIDTKQAQVNVIARNDLVRQQQRKELVVNSPQLEKILFWFDCEILPPRWEMDVLLGNADEVAERKSRDREIGSSESDSGEGRCDSDEESTEDLEAKDHMYAELVSFMEARNTPINSTPTLANKDLDLVQLHTLVMKHGGCKAVTSALLWPLIYTKMNLPFLAGGSTRLEQAYKKFLLPFEETRRQLGQAATMPLGRRRQPTGGNKTTNIPPPPHGPVGTSTPISKTRDTTAPLPASLASAFMDCEQLSPSINQAMDLNSPPTSSSIASGEPKRRKTSRAANSTHKTNERKSKGRRSGKLSSPEALSPFSGKSKRILPDNASDSTITSSVTSSSISKVGATGAGTLGTNASTTTTVLNIVNSPPQAETTSATAPEIITGGEASTPVAGAAASGGESILSPPLFDKLGAGTWVKVKHDNDLQTFVAQIKRRTILSPNSDRPSGQVIYRVHYRGYNRRHDGDITPDKIIELISTPKPTSGGSGKEQQMKKELTSADQTQSSSSSGDDDEDDESTASDTETERHSQGLTSPRNLVSPTPSSTNHAPSMPPRRKFSPSGSSCQASPPKLTKVNGENSSLDNGPRDNVFSIMEKSINSAARLYAVIPSPPPTSSINSSSNNLHHPLLPPMNTCDEMQRPLSVLSSTLSPEMPKIDDSRCHDNLTVLSPPPPALSSPPPPTSTTKSITSTTPTHNHNNFAEMQLDCELDEGEDEGELEQHDLSTGGGLAPSTPSTLPMNEEDWVEADVDSTMYSRQTIDDAAGQRSPFEMMSSPTSGQVSTLDSPIMVNLTDAPTDGEGFDTIISPRRQRRSAANATAVSSTTATAASVAGGNSASCAGGGACGSEQQSTLNASYQDDESSFMDEQNNGFLSQFSPSSGLYARTIVKIPFEWPEDRPYVFPYPDFLPENINCLSCEEKIREFEKALQFVAEEWRNQKKLIRDIESNGDYKRMRKRYLNMQRNK